MGVFLFSVRGSEKEGRNGRKFGEEEKEGGRGRLVHYFVFIFFVVVSWN